MGKLLMRTGTVSWRTRTPTCRSRAAENLSRRRCITLCDSPAATGCTPDICQVILLRTVACVCQNNTPLRFSMPCKSGLPSPCSAEHQLTVTTQVNRSRAFRAVVSAHSWVRVSHLHLLLDGGDKSWRRQSYLWRDNLGRQDCLPHSRLVVGIGIGVDAGGLGPVRKIDKISQDIERLVALRID